MHVLSRTKNRPMITIGGFSSSIPQQKRHSHLSNHKRHHRRAFSSTQAAVSSNAAFEGAHDSGLTHVGADGRARMIDISWKDSTQRSACAQAVVDLPLAVAAKLWPGEVSVDATPGTYDGSTLDVRAAAGKKGAVFDTAVIAGTMGVKRTAELIPFCHPLPINKCDFDYGIPTVHAPPTVEPINGTDTPADNRFRIPIYCTVGTFGQTGIEMEAIAGANVAALCVYDMVKALSHDIYITDVRLIRKRGGKSDFGV